MAEIMVVVMKLQFVKEIQRNEAETAIRFVDGQKAQIANRDPHYARWLTLAERSRDRKHPMGIAVGPDSKVTDAARADSDIVSKVTATEQGAEVMFQGHDGIFHLRKDNPQAAKIRELLSQSEKKGSRVWFVATKPALEIADAILFEEEKPK